MGRRFGLAVLAVGLTGVGAAGLRHQGPAPRPEGGPVAGEPRGFEPWDDPPTPRALSPTETERLLGAARAIAPALVQVGHPAGDSGTAFVISRRHRLLATNAHVASIFDECGGLLAVANGTLYVYRVERVWVHPDDRLAREGGVILKGGRVSVYSRQLGPDLAVLKLAAGGPELAAECRLAGPGGLDELEGEPVGKMGFAGPLSRRREATVAVQTVGVVTRVNPLAASWDLSRRWRLVEASIPMQSGESGSPIFLSDGRVVAVSTWGRYAMHPEAGAPRRSIGTTGIRVDGLRELLRVPGLAGLVPEVDAASPAGRP